MGSSCPSSDDFSVVVLASDLGIDARTLLSNQDGEEVEVKQDEDQWHDCAQYLTSDEDFSDLDCLQFFRLQGSDKSGNRIFRIVGKYFPLRCEWWRLKRWIYEELPSEIKERLQIVYFIHPGLRSRLVFATLGRFFLSGGLYWKIKYVSRLQYLWHDIKKGEVEIPEFVKHHDDVLEERPLTDYGIEPDHMNLTGVPSMSQSFGRYEQRWVSTEFSS